MGESEREQVQKAEKTTDFDKMTPLEQAEWALQHVKDAPISSDGMRSPEEDPPEAQPAKQTRRRANLDVKTATDEDIDAFVKHLRGDDD